MYRMPLLGRCEIQIQFCVLFFGPKYFILFLHMWIKCMYIHLILWFYPSILSRIACNLLTDCSKPIPSEPWTYLPTAKAPETKAFKKIAGKAVQVIGLLHAIPPARAEPRMANGTLTGANGLRMGDLLVRLWRRREAVSSPEMSGLSFFKKAAYSWPRKNVHPCRSQL